jgi:4-hydroxy-tetrahydrodipicolinate synthase
LPKGSGVALITPFNDDLTIDWKAMERLIELHNKAKTDFFVLGGTTGESVSLSVSELRDIIQFVKDKKHADAKIIAGVGKNYLKGTLELLEMANQLSIDGVMVVCPYYNKPTQEGLYQYFKEVAKNTNYPVIVYNVPGRTASNILPPTVIRLLEDVENIAGLKDATGNLVQFSELYSGVKGKLNIYSGEDAINYPLMALGAVGVISVVANVMPEEVRALTQAVLKREKDKALALHYKLLHISQALFYETNPIPVKTALFWMGLIKENFRLPLVKMSENGKEKLKKVLQKEYKLI